MIKTTLVEDVQVDMIYGDESGELPPFNECRRFAGKEEYEEICALLNKAVDKFIEEFMQKNNEAINKKDLNLWICFVNSIDPKEYERLASQVYQTEALYFRGDWKYLFGRGYAIYGADNADYIYFPWIFDPPKPLTKEQLFKNLGKNLIEKTVDYSSMAASDASIYGLFWFKKKEYKKEDIIPEEVLKIDPNNEFSDLYIADQRVFTDLDLDNKVFKGPEKGHSEVDGESAGKKRGRVVLNGGLVTILVGKNCPIFECSEYTDNSVMVGTNLVMKRFNLGRHKSRVRYRQGSHWNGNGN
jgi:hypothetical protein